MGDSRGRGQGVQWKTARRETHLALKMLQVGIRIAEI